MASLPALAINLKLLRVQHGLTLEQVAQSTGLTKSNLSKVERGLSSPSIESALAIAKAVGVTVDRLFGRPSEGDPITIIRPDRAEAADSPDAMSLVAGLSSNRVMRAFVIHPSHQAPRGRLMSHHEGEEILYVLEGEVELHIARRKENLTKGACVHFESATPHRLIAVGKKHSSVLVVVASTKQPQN
ncbi:helix-turn-helix domain-containing protein (plasmid) [Ralstonia sp. 25C]|uniref:helix-turn-helix domain-containing protein n=1 Tax=Ralstonia sp. 25C TaxID=3447363 RepID=UPI003F750CC9